MSNVSSQESMLRWSESPQLRELSAFYAELSEKPEKFTDEQIVQAVQRAFVQTNCWGFVEAVFAVISPACAVRPQLTRLLIEEPVRAMVYGGLEDPSLVVAQGVALASKAEPTVELTAEGRRWLLEEWPKYDAVARQVFKSIVDESLGS